MHPNSYFWSSHNFQSRLMLKLLFLWEWQCRQNVMCVQNQLRKTAYIVKRKETGNSEKTTFDPVIAFNHNSYGTA